MKKLNGNLWKVGKSIVNDSISYKFHIIYSFVYFKKTLIIPMNWIYSTMIEV